MKKILIVIAVIISILGVLAIAESLLKKKIVTNIKDETLTTASSNINENIPSEIPSASQTASTQIEIPVEVKEDVKQPIKEPIKEAASTPIVKEETKEKEEEKPVEEKPVEIDTGDNFTLTDINGKTVKLSDYRGKKVFVNFWATWCGPCVSEMPHIQKIFLEYPEIQILTINSSDAISKINSFMSDNNYTFKVLIDSTGEVSDKYRVNAIPTSILYDEKGNVINKIVGSMNEDMMIRFLKLN